MLYIPSAAFLRKTELVYYALGKFTNAPSDRILIKLDSFHDVFRIK